MLGLPHQVLLASAALAIGAAAINVYGEAEGSGATSPEIVAAPVVGELSSEGIPGETQWAQAPALELAQQDPHPGEPTRYRTEVRVLTDACTCTCT
jgi:hypothetical protein